VDIYPITDPAANCSEPLNDMYADNQMRGYYATPTTIRSLLPTDTPAR